MATATIPPLESRPIIESIPPLENGDRMSRPEFERRYNAMPDVRAELIEGVVYMASPVRCDNHAGPHYQAIGWLNLYSYVTPGIHGADNASIRLDLDNMPQPDALLYILQSCGGQARIAADGYIEDAPDLIVEVASSTVSYDLNAKFDAYRRNGVKEYVVWRTRDRAVDWFVLEQGQYLRLQPGQDGIYRSRVLPGLWLDPTALMSDDRATMLRVNAEGTTTPEHTAFVEQLRLAGVKE